MACPWLLQRRRLHVGGQCMACLGAWGPCFSYRLSPKPSGDLPSLSLPLGNRLPGSSPATSSQGPCLYTPPQRVGVAPARQPTPLPPHSPPFLSPRPTSLSLPPSLPCFPPFLSSLSPLCLCLPPSAPASLQKRQADFGFFLQPFEICVLDIRSGHCNSWIFPNIHPQQPGTRGSDGSMSRRFWATAELGLAGENSTTEPPVTQGALRLRSGNSKAPPPAAPAPGVAHAWQACAPRLPPPTWIHRHLRPQPSTPLASQQRPHMHVSNSM